MHCLYRKKTLALFKAKMQDRLDYKLVKTCAGLKAPKDGALYHFSGGGFSGVILFSPRKSAEDVFELGFGWSFNGEALFEQDLTFNKEYSVNQELAIIKREAFMMAVSSFSGRISSSWRLDSLSARAIHVTSKMKEKEAIKYYDEVYNMELKLSDEELRQICEPVVDQMIECIDEHVTPFFKEVMPRAVLCRKSTDQLQ